MKFRYEQNMKFEKTERLKLFLLSHQLLRTAVLPLLVFFPGTFKINEYNISLKVLIDSVNLYHTLILLFHCI